jgi:hypothetical protein
VAHVREEGALGLARLAGGFVRLERGAERRFDDRVLLLDALVLGGELLLRAEHARVWTWE